MTWILKYLFAVATGTLSTQAGPLIEMIPMEKLPLLMIIYGLGFVLYMVMSLFDVQTCLGKGRTTRIK